MKKHVKKLLSAKVARHITHILEANEVDQSYKTHSQ